MLTRTIKFLVLICSLIAAVASYADVSSVVTDRSSAVINCNPFIATITLDAAAGIGGVDVTVEHSPNTFAQATVHIDEGDSIASIPLYAPNAILSPQEAWIRAYVPGQITTPTANVNI